MKKYAPVLLLTALLVLLLATSSLAAGKPSTPLSIYLDGRKLSFAVQPKTMQGTTYLPVRALYEALGAEVHWDPQTRLVTATADGLVIKIDLTQGTITRNGSLLKLDAPAPVVLNRQIYLPIRVVSATLDKTVTWEEQSRSIYLTTVEEQLPVVGSLQALQELLSQAQNHAYGYDRGGLAAMPVRNAMKTQEAAADGNAQEEYSSTNVQVEGVDEADLVKTDGSYIYKVNNRQVIIIRANPPEKMAVAGTITFQEQVAPLEMYVDDKYLAVIGMTSRQVPLIRDGALAPKIYPPIYAQSTTTAFIYDLSDKSNPQKLREIELDGNYLSSRKIGSSLYLLSNKMIDYYYIQKEEAENPEAWLPTYRDSAAQQDPVQIGCSEIRYFPGTPVANYLLIAGVNLDEPEEKAQVSTYLGAGNNVYASTDNLYIAVTQYKQSDASNSTGQQKIMPMPVYAEDTAVYKFALDNGRVKYRGKGEVPGTILNQFSMEEHQGYFRIATTSGDIWRTDENTSKNNLYILDQDLKITGKIENMAPGERIYSARFLGDRGYMVTFKTVDPLFVLDLRNPQEPKILGALKIPGYSDYLHPYDENHVLGFGKDTAEISVSGGNKEAAASMAFYQGMKMALFDVSDVQNPKEKFKEIIGDRGTDSELLRNHKALLFVKDKGLLAFPVSVAEVPQQDKTQVTAYGQFVFQGAYVYHLDAQSGFKLRGKITHLTEEDYQKAGSGWYDSNKNVERILYIGNTLYTLSQSMIKANDLNSLQEISALELPN